MAAGRKQAVSLRIGASELRRVKQLGRRLGVGDSEIIRFAVKAMLAKLAPLCDPNIRGRRLLPMFVDEYATDFLQHFDLDSERLNDIMNTGTDDQTRIEMEDLQLLAMSGMRHQYQGVRFRAGAAPTLEPARVAPMRAHASRNFETVSSNAVVAMMAADGKK